MEFETQLHEEPVEREIQSVGETEGSAGEPEISQEPAPEYQPNYKFSVGDKELEFDERVRSLITDKESEEYFRDIYTKAHGLELSKQRSEETRKKYEETTRTFGELRTQFDHVQTTLKKLNELKSGDFGTFQKVWEIPDAEILRRASEIVKTHDDPEARDRLERYYGERVEALKYQDRSERDNQSSQILQRQIHEMKMERAMSEPEIQRFSKEYDRRIGQAGAFAEEVARLGTIEFHQGRYLDPQVAVSQAFQRLSKLVPLSDAEPASSQQKPREQARSAPLPNLGTGRSGSSVKKKITSLNDLRKIARQMES